MRIVAINEQTIRLTTASRNSSISFDGMTASAIAIHTDARKDGKPLIGLAFDSIGRYGHGALLRERFIPRLLDADPRDYSDGNGGIDPDKAWAIAMRNEKPGGHGERPGAVGLLDAAFYDLAAKNAEFPLWAYLARQDGRDAGNRIVGLYCPKCSIRYEPSNCEDRIAEHVRTQQDLVLTGSDIKTRRA